MGFVPKESKRPKYGSAMPTSLSRARARTATSRRSSSDDQAYHPPTLSVRQTLHIHWGILVHQGDSRTRSAQAESRGFLGRNILDSGFNCNIYVHTGAGATFAGGDGAPESLEGKRGIRG
jgi:hypothetical protein